ncbi:cysteine-rich CWC family protein [Niastella yeongjuensis]|uniref:cysteine-rich CWC family protein n=1 Tax=Niastella yeongjuensis TaxID=354355 RepID=UPI0008C41ED7|nr:Cysteine-rich CWC [Niastella yeongjuensis]
MIKKCSKCETAFNCQNESRGCWCEEVQLSTRQLDYLKENYENCLCPNCLKEFETFSKLPE